LLHCVAARNDPKLTVSKISASVQVHHNWHHEITVSPSEIDSFEGPHRHNRDQAARGDPAPRWGPIAKRITWMVLIAASLLFFYLLDKLQEALSMLK